MFNYLLGAELFSQADTLVPRLDRRISFKEYVFKNLKYSEIAVENNMEDRVEFRIQVSGVGGLDSIQIIESRHKLLSREVIRLLEKTKCD